jgi:hypothetical protein
MRWLWIIVVVVTAVTATCYAEKAKKEAKKPPAAPPVQPKVILGYRAGQWGMNQVAVMGKEGKHQDVQEEPDYLLQLGLPDDVKALVPEKLPRRAPFRNFEAMLDIDAAECKIVYHFFEDKLYMIWCKEPLLRHLYKFKDWRQKMLDQLGATTSEKPDGTLIWDQDITYCTATPTFVTSGTHTDDTLLEYYIVFLYSEKLKKEIIDWAKQNLKRANE